MRYPVSEGVIAHIAVAVDEYAAAGQVREHGAGISSGHMELKNSGRFNILPVRHKDDSLRINVGLHYLNLSAYQFFLLRRGSQNRIAICGTSSYGCLCFHQLSVSVCVSPTDR